MVDKFNTESLKSKQLPPAWPKGLFTFVFIVFLLTLGGYFGLNYWNQKQEANLNVLVNEFQNLRDSFALEDEREVILFEKKLNTLSKLLSNHIYFSEVLLSLEELTHPKVSYNNLDFSTDRGLISLSGIAENQEVLSEAVSGLVNNPDKVKAVVVKEMQLNKEKQATFSLDIYIQPNILKYQTDDRNQ
jgi:hypothetical protein